MEQLRKLTKITINTLLRIDVSSLRAEAERLGKELKEGSNDGVTKVFMITPDFTTAEKGKIQALINKIGTGSIT